MPNFGFMIKIGNAFFNQSGFDTDITYETDCKWGNMTNLNLVRNDGE